MDIYWYGQACFKLKGKSASIVIDPYNPDFVGLKPPKDLEADICLVSHDHKDHSEVSLVSGEPKIFNGAGEYDAKGIAVVGVGTFHDNKKGAERGRNTVYNCLIDGLNIVHLGDIGHVLSEEEVAEIGETDILLVPVGGVYTIEAKEAAEIISQLEPRIIIPMHYLLPGLKFGLDPLDKFLKEMGVEEAVPASKLSITKEKLPEEPQVIVLTKS